ncbi:MAG: hypothetical protein NTZ17_12905 [Phycisphaerae bacterium]|nr:hypothetical protein [Phycisphaerae bacterium]
MKIEFHRDKAKPLTKILFAVAVLLGALVFLKIGFFVSSSNAMMMAAETDPSRAGATDLKTVLAQTKASADEIKKKNLFVPVPANQYPVNEVIGILGREALIGDKWYKVGDRVGDAKIIAIEPTKVKVVWNGQEKEFSPIGSSGSGGRGDGSGPSGRMSGAGAGSRRGPGMAAGVSSADRDKLRQQFMNASPEERQRLRELMRGKMGARDR